MLLTSVCSYFGEVFFFGGGGGMLQTTPIEKEKNTTTVRIGSFYIWQTRDQVCVLVIIVIHKFKTKST